MADALSQKSISEIAAGLESGAFSSRQVTEACLAAAKARVQKTHAYVALMEEQALAAADASDVRRKKGERLSPLDGVPLAIKDNMLVAGVKATSGSNIIKDYVAPYDGTVVTRLKNAGAVLLGKTNMDEFAMGSSTETSCHGPTMNPWDVSRIPGGSSGGSAVAVAEGSAIASLGSDTGGSIRQPASLCGVVGLKPTYGRVSRYGLMAMASSLDQIGPFTRTVGDAALLLSAIEGRDPMDSTSVDLRDEWKLPADLREALPAGKDASAPLKGIRVGIPKEYFPAEDSGSGAGDAQAGKGGMEPGVEASVRAAIETLRSLGAEIKEISLPHTEYGLAVYYVLMPAEVSSNLARFDGIRYGARVAGATLEETYRKSRGQGFGREARRRIMLGTYALSSGYYDAYYLKAQKVRRLISNDFVQAFTECDVIATPASPSIAWKLGDKADDPLSMYLADVFTVSANVAGVPGISVPCGLSEGMPVGLQLMGKHFDEKTLLAVAQAFETRTGFAEKYQPKP